MQKESEIIAKYFPSPDRSMYDMLEALGDLYRQWNSIINVISRKDMPHFYERHVLHSLAIARVIRFKPGTTVLDAGTGGGFPGIPLAVMFPETRFILLDSIAKKMRVVQDVAGSLGLDNVETRCQRVENIQEKVDFVVSRAVTAFPRFVDLVAANIKPGGYNDLPNGILYLKGGEFDDELEPFRQRTTVYELRSFFEEDFFETKKIIHLRF